MDLIPQATVSITKLVKKDQQKEKEDTGRPNFCSYEILLIGELTKEQSQKNSQKSLVESLTEKNNFSPSYKIQEFNKIYENENYPEKTNFPLFSNFQEFDKNNKINENYENVYMNFLDDEGGLFINVDKDFMFDPFESLNDFHFNL